MQTQACAEGAYCQRSALMCLWSLHHDHAVTTNTISVPCPFCVSQPSLLISCVELRPLCSPPLCPMSPVKKCNVLPLAALAPYSMGWPNNASANATCIGTTIGGNCKAACDANSGGTGYTALCNDTNTWAVSGNCTREPHRGCDLHQLSSTSLHAVNYRITENL